MAKTQGQSSALALFKRQTKGAYTKARDVAPKPSGFVNLPGGLNGVGRLTKAELTTTKDKGKGVSAMVSLRFIVREPIDYDGVQQNKNYVLKEKTEGKNPKSIADIVKEICNDLQLLGVETQGTDEDDLPRLLEELTEAKPYFRFSTWEFQQGDMKTPMYGINVIGQMPDYQPTTDEPEVQEAEEPEAEPEAEPEPEPEPVKSKTKGPKGPKGPKSPIKAPEPEPEAEEEEPEPEPEADESSDDSWVPAVGDHYKCTLGGGHDVVVVTAVDEDAKVVSVLVKSTDKARNGKKWNKIAWSKLEGD